MTDTKGKIARKGRPPRQPFGGVDLDAFGADETLDAIAATDSAPAPVERPAMRPAMREEDPRAAAARRAAEIRGHLGSMDEGSDEFAAPPAPPGWSYEWKRKTVLGQEDPAYQVHLARMGWEAVPTSRHPEMMPGQGSYPTIERKGMMLMMRPEVISEEARAIELRKARGQVRAKEEQLSGTPEGGLGHRDHPQARPRINKGYEPIPVPKD